MSKIDQDHRADLNLDIWEDNEPMNKTISQVTISNDINDCDDLFSVVLNHYEPSRKTNTIQTNDKKTSNIQVQNQTNQANNVQKQNNQINSPKKKKKSKNRAVIRMERDDQWSDYDTYL